ncbi:MAG: DNA protection during starvation protein, partial [uncultured Rubrobacteraceae bacterium]
GGRTRSRGHPLRGQGPEARGDHRTPEAGVLRRTRDGNELRHGLHQPGRGQGAGDKGVPRRGHPGGAPARPAVCSEDQGTLWYGAGLTGLQGRADPLAAARRADGRGELHQGRHRRGDQGDRALHEDRGNHRRGRPRDAGHGDSHPARRAGTPPPLRRLPARVRGRGAGL